MSYVSDAPFSFRIGSGDIGGWMGGNRNPGNRKSWKTLVGEIGIKLDWKNKF